MTQPPNPVELARQRDPKSIANLLNARTLPLNTTTKISLKGDVLQLLMESSEEPDRDRLLPIVQGFLVKLKIVGVDRVRVYGRSRGQDVPEWSSEFEIVETQDPTPASVIPQKKIKSFQLAEAGTIPKTPLQERIANSEVTDFSLSGVIVGLIVSSPMIWGAFYGPPEFLLAYLLSAGFIITICYISGLSQGLNLFSIKCPSCSHPFRLSGDGGECPACQEKLVIDDRGNCQTTREGDR